MNLAGYRIENILQILGGCLELQVPNVKCFHSPLPLSVEVHRISALSRAAEMAFRALSCTLLGSLGAWNFLLPWFSDLLFRPDLTGVDDVSVDVSVGTQCKVA